MTESRPGAPYARAHTGWFICRMNEIYYSAKIRRAKAFDYWLRFGSFLLSSGGVFAAVHFFGDHKWVPIVTGLVSASLSAATLVFKFPEQAQGAAAILPQYTQVGAKFRELFYLGEEATMEDVAVVLAELDRIHVSEGEKAPSVDDKMLLEADKKARSEGLGTYAAA